MFLYFLVGKTVLKSLIHKFLKRRDTSQFVLPKPTVNLPTSEQPETSTDTYPTSTSAVCIDEFDQCSSWLTNNYNNNYRQFCGQQGYESLCCETCLDWQSRPHVCIDSGYNGLTCDELLKYGVDNNKEELCNIFDSYCCSTCAYDDADDNNDDDNNDDDDDDDDGDDDDDDDDTCVDAGYSTLTCGQLLEYGTNNDLKTLCQYFSSECCKTCSGKLI